MGNWCTFNGRPGEISPRADYGNLPAGLLMAFTRPLQAWPNPHRHDETGVDMTLANGAPSFPGRSLVFSPDERSALGNFGSLSMRIRASRAAWEKVTWPPRRITIYLAMNEWMRFQL